MNQLLELLLFQLAKRVSLPFLEVYLNSLVLCQAVKELVFNQVLANDGVIVHLELLEVVDVRNIPHKLHPEEEIAFVGQNDP
jgi:hypothetical protein